MIICLYSPSVFGDTLGRIVSYTVHHTEHTFRMIFGKSASPTLTSACFASKNLVSQKRHHACTYRKAVGRLFGAPALLPLLWAEKRRG